MTGVRGFMIFVIFTLLALLLGACVRVNDPSLYLLTAVPGTPAASAETARAPRVVALKPVALPKYLKGLRIVLRKHENQLEMAKGQRWAEPLAENFTRVLAGNLAQRLGLEQVYLYPRQAPAEVDVVIGVVVNHFIGSRDAGVDLEAHWRIESPQQVDPLHSATSTFHQDVAEAGDTAALVQAMSRSVAALADRIAAELGQAR